MTDLQHPTSHPGTWWSPPPGPTAQAGLTRLAYVNFAGTQMNDQLGRQLSLLPTYLTTGPRMSRTSDTLTEPCEAPPVRRDPVAVTLDVPITPNGELPARTRRTADQIPTNRSGWQDSQVRAELYSNGQYRQWPRPVESPH